VFLIVETTAPNQPKPPFNIVSDILLIILSCLVVITLPYFSCCSSSVKSSSSSKPGIKANKAF
jgi:hypothetical protein